MAATRPHIIQRQTIELQMPTRLPHMQIQDNAIALFKEELRARIGETLDRLFPGEDLVRLDRIVIDLGRIPVENWEEDFVSRFVEEFELAMEAAQQAHVVEAAAQGQAGGSGVAAEEQERGPWAALAYFLDHGFLPWWQVERHKTTIQDLVRALLAGPTGMPTSLQAQIRNTLSTPLALQRLVQALPDTLLAELAQVFGTLDADGVAAQSTLIRLLSLPAQGISRVAARYAVWAAVLAGEGAARRMRPADVLVEAIHSLAEHAAMRPTELLHVAVEADPQLSSALLRDVAQVQARLQETPAQAQARAQEAQLRRVVTALQGWLQQADPQQFDLDKALGLLRDLQAALTPGPLLDNVAAAIAQLNGFCRHSAAPVLAAPPASTLQRLHQAMRQEAAHCPASVLLAMQDFYLQLSLLHAPAVQHSLFAAPMQQLAIELMRLNASAGASSQGPYLHASARQLLATLDARENGLRLQADSTASSAQPALIGTDQVAGIDTESISGKNWGSMAEHPTAKQVWPTNAASTQALAPTLSTMATQASAFIAAQIAALAHQGQQSPGAVNLAVWRAWFKALRGPELRPLLTQHAWRELLQAIGELLAGQPQPLQLRTIHQLADACQQAALGHRGPGASPAALRTALEELVELTDATAAPKDYARTQARLRAIASLLHDTAAAHTGTAEADSPQDALPLQDAWLPLRASLHALATFGATALTAAGVSARQIAALHELLALPAAKVTPTHAEHALGLLLAIGARLEAAEASRGVQVLPALAHPAFEAVQVASPGSPASADEALPLALMQKIAGFLQTLIALTARLELDLAPAQRPSVSKASMADWRKVWDGLRNHIVDQTLRSGVLSAAEPGMDTAVSLAFSHDPPGRVQVVSGTVVSTKIWSLPRLGIDGLSIESEGKISVSPLETRPERQQIVPDNPLAIKPLGGDDFLLTAWDPAGKLSSLDPVEFLPASFMAADQTEAVDSGLHALAQSLLSRRLPHQHPVAEHVEVPDAEHGAAATSPHLVQATKTAPQPFIRATASPELELAGATLLLSIAHMLAPALQGGTLTDMQAAWWHSAPVDMVGRLADALEAGQVSPDLLAAWEKMRVLDSSEKRAASMRSLSSSPASSEGFGGQIKSFVAGKAGDRVLHLDREARVQELDMAAKAQEAPQPLDQPFWRPGSLSLTAKLPWIGLLAVPTTLQLEHKNLPDPANGNPKVGRERSFRCLLSGAGSPLRRRFASVSREQSAAEDQYAGKAVMPNDLLHWPAAFKKATRHLAAPIRVSNSATLATIQAEEVQARHRHLLAVSTEALGLLQAHPSGQALPSQPILLQIQQWMQQFPGQALPKSLAKGLIGALEVLELGLQTSQAASPVQDRGAESGVEMREAALDPTALPLKQVGLSDPSSASGSDELNSESVENSAKNRQDMKLTAFTAASGPLNRIAQNRLPVPKIAYLAPESNQADTVHSQLLRPLPVPILSTHALQDRVMRLLASVQRLLALQAPAQGLRRILDPLAQASRPLPSAPSLSEPGRQQLAQAAAQAKSLLREPLPAQMHAALRNLQNTLSGQSQGRPDLKAVQRISAEASALLTSKVKGKPALKAPEKELSIYVQNAGLVLLWPFIQRFLQNLGLVEGRAFVSPEAHGRAVLFLQYLADPDPETAEHLLPLCKLLCGYPDDRPITLELLPSKEEIAACEGLLATVPSHHPAMKNMRVEGFRTAWLQREGALKPRGDHHLLHVEKQAYDILLEQLPWSIRVIRLPWMHTAILTEW